MTFTRTFDYQLLHDLVVRDPRLYDAMADDFAPSIAEYSGPLQNEGIWYVLARGVGFFMFVPHSAICWEIHTVMPMWGTVQTAREVVEWIWANTSCRRIVTAIPAYNRVAQRFARRAGMVAFGINKKSFSKGGVLHDEVWMGISPGEK